MACDNPEQLLKRELRRTLLSRFAPLAGRRDAETGTMIQQFADTWFDEQWYINEYADLKKAKVNARHHFLNFGVFEGRIPSPKLLKLNTDGEIEAALNICKKPADLIKNNDMGLHNTYLKHLCNICNKEANFIPVFYRNEGACPYCTSCERHRAVAIHLWHYLPLLINKSILHFAPEPPLKQILTSIPVNYVAASYDPVKQTGINIKAIPYPDQTFHLVLLNQVLEHIDDDELAISELYRITAPNGIIIITVPLLEQYHKRIYKRINGTEMPHLDHLDPDITFEIKDLQLSPEICKQLYGQQDHLRIYGKADLLKRLASPGFHVDIYSSSSYPSQIRERLQIIDDVIICTKLGR